MIIKKGVVISCFQAKNRGHLRIKNQSGSIANIIPRGAGCRRNRLTRSEGIRLLANDEGIGRLDLISFTEGMIQGGVEGVILVVMVRVATGTLVIIDKRVLIIELEGRLLALPVKTEPGSDRNTKTPHLAWTAGKSADVVVVKSTEAGGHVPELSGIGARV